MANDSFMFQYLKEKIDKGFPSPKHPDLLREGSYIYIPRNSNTSYVDPKTTDIKISQKPGSYKVAMFFDGPFFPVRNGACYNIYNLMRTLGNSLETDVTFVNCYRGWDETESYYNMDFDTTFLTPDDYYVENGLLEQVMLSQNVQIAHFFDTEVLVTIAPRHKRLGIKIVLETQNIDHILLERLGVNPDEIAKARVIQADALRMADYNLFRSKVDIEWGLKLGADPATSATYKGGICVNDFTFKVRKNAKKLVFLGHMFYQPNENALHVIMTKILPKLPDGYTLTVIGITPPKLIEKYKNVSNITFLKGVDNLDSVLHSFDIALAPLLEGSGTRLKLLDYLASGLPIIATTLAVEGLDPRIHKYITIEDDVDTYATLIQSVANEMDVLTERAISGREFVEQVYDWPNCIQPFLNAYSALLNPHKV